MLNQVIMMLHAFTGVLAMLAGLWVFVEALNASPENLQRIRFAAVLVAVFLWATYLIGGYWYLVYYGPEKAIIEAGPWPEAHSVVMESKEHLFLLLLMLGSYLLLPAFGSGAGAYRGERLLILWCSGLVVLGALAMDGFGALIGMGVKLALLPGQEG